MHKTQQEIYLEVIVYMVIWQSEDYRKTVYSGLQCLITIMIPFPWTCPGIWVTYGWYLVGTVEYHRDDTHGVRGQAESGGSSLLSAVFVCCQIFLMSQNLFADTKLTDKRNGIKYALKQESRCCETH